MKKILIMAAVAFMFSACNKCKECTHDDYEYETWDSNTGTTETYGDQILEVCSDNFESKADFKDYIEAMEDEDWECKSDFWN
jgi:hypothetical protein